MAMGSEKREKLDLWDRLLRSFWISDLSLFRMVWCVFGSLAVSPAQLWLPFLRKFKVFNLVFEMPAQRSVMMGAIWIVGIGVLLDGCYIAFVLILFSLWAPSGSVNSSRNEMMSVFHVDGISTL